MKEDRREYSRKNFSGELVYNACSNAGAEWADTRQGAHGEGVDVSESGLCLITGADVKDGQIVRISVPLPGMSMQVPTLAMIMWSKPHADGYKVGLKFVL